MSRVDRSTMLKGKICDVARDLFIAQGYRSTTIRQIIGMAGIQIGTLYHYYRDKEDILLQIVLETYEEIMGIAKKIIGSRTDSALQYAIIYALEMKAVERYRQVAEIYYESYSSWRITEVMTAMNVQRNKQFFGRYNDYSDDEYYLRTLALRGMRLIIISEHLHAGALDFGVKIPYLIRTGLSSFEVPADKAERTIAKAMKAVAVDRFRLHGLGI
ncbi:MAG: TetR/AcrR family transcriptional regulator [Spirochaetes bacterium]|nr:TetR/AcrR family transcriptional regulator [Spirochaetota bacterium]